MHSSVTDRSRVLQATPQQPAAAAERNASAFARAPRGEVQQLLDSSSSSNKQQQQQVAESERQQPEQQNEQQRPPSPSAVPFLSVAVPQLQFAAPALADITSDAADAAAASAGGFLNPVNGTGFLVGAVAAGAVLVQKKQAEVRA